MPQRENALAEFRETWPFLAVVTAVLLAAYVTALRADATLTRTPRLMLFTGLVAVTGALYWAGAFVVTNNRHRIAYVVALATATFGIALMTPQHWAAFGLYPALIGLVVGLFWGEVPSIAIAVGISVVLFAANLILGRGLQELLKVSPFVAVILGFTVVYVVLFNRQVEARKRTQALLADLESAHRRLRDYADQVEALTLGRERERMGRELHDTLAQGLAGLIMQLEAIDGHLAAGASERARAVVQQAMQRSRATLLEARRAIQALRASALDHADLVQAIRREAAAFEASTGTPCSCEVSGEVSEVVPEKAQDVLRVVQECLSNATRHARASRVNIRVEASGGEMHVVVSDDGAGFDAGRAQAGFGLAGMRERAARLGGTLRFESAPGRGTTVELVFKAARP